MHLRQLSTARHRAQASSAASSPKKGLCETPTFCVPTTRYDGQNNVYGEVPILAAMTTLLIRQETSTLQITVAALLPRSWNSPDLLYLEAVKTGGVATRCKSCFTFGGTRPLRPNWNVVTKRCERCRWWRSRWRRRWGRARKHTAIHEGWR